MGFHGNTPFSNSVSVSMCSKRRAGHRGAHGQWEAQEGAQAPDHLLQLPAGGAAEEIPVGAVPGAAGAGRAGGTAGPHADAGQAAEGNLIIGSNVALRVRISVIGFEYLLSFVLM